MGVLVHQLGLKDQKHGVPGARKSDAAAGRPFLSAANSTPSAFSLGLQRKPACPCGGGCPRCRKESRGAGLQRKLAVSVPGDPYEREADRVAETVVASPSPAAMQRKCACEGGPPCPECAADQGELLQRKAGAAGNNSEMVSGAFPADLGPGQALAEDARAFFEPRFGHDFSRVRVHTDGRAAESARAVSALAYTVGRNVVFDAGQYSPETPHGRRLLAHELTHVVQQGAGGRPAGGRGGAAVSLLENGPPGRIGGVAQIQTQTAGPILMRDLAIAPPNPAAAEPALTDDEINAAIRYNQLRFQDPYTVMIVRDVVGIPKYPAVSDRDLALALARWQSEFNLTVDGKIGPVTTRTIVRELRAEDQRVFANLLREDNMVFWGTVNGPAYRACGEFQWDVNFSTTLREGWLIQRIDNTWNATSCAGADVTPAFTRRYWEAWWVDHNGRVRIPTSTVTPPSTAAPATADDLWFNPPVANSNGTWSEAGTLYTTLTLPAGFAIHGVPEAVDLPSTVGPVRSDDLGLPEASRRRAGRWDCCNADPAQQFHRAT